MNNQEKLLKVIREKLEYAEKRYNNSVANWEINKYQEQANLLIDILKESGLENEIKTINLDWDMINTEGVSIVCDSKNETKKFLLECEKKGMIWQSGLKPTEVSLCYRTISTNGGKFLTENHDNKEVSFKSIISW